MAMILLSNLSFGYEGSYQSVFEDLSIALDTDWCLGLTGRNGRGKTTLLRLLLGAQGAAYGLRGFTGSIQTKVRFGYFPAPVEHSEWLALEVAQQICPDCQQWQLEREPVDLARELADQLAAAYEQLEQAGLQVSVKIADGLPPVWGDRNGVVRVLSNLLTNAYRHGTGTLEARLYREGDHVVSAFSNDAPGMTDEDVERVFERFYTVDRMRTGQNTGLGMAIVKALAERMGGQVSARLEDGRFTAQVSWKAAG